MFAAPENVAETKMDVNNLATVMAPSCLRSRHSIPERLLEHTTHEMSFVRTLIENLDTTDMEGIIWHTWHDYETAVGRRFVASYFIAMF